MHNMHFHSLTAVIERVLRRRMEVELQHFPHVHTHHETAALLVLYLHGMTVIENNERRGGVINFERRRQWRIHHRSDIDRRLL